MYYPKNKENELSNELFENPTSEYRATPFWSWNCKLDPDELCRQIDDFKKMGFGGFYMHSRSGLATDYLGEEFMDAVKSCADKAKKENMLACLYDEDRYSSGFGGGFVTSIPRYRQRSLIFTREERKAEPNRDKASETGDIYLEAVYDITANENGELLDYRLISPDKSARGEKWFAYSVADLPGDWFNNATYVDAFSKEAIDKFIEVTHEKYKETVGDMFGKTVPSIFTDEILHKKFLPFAESGKGEAALPWSICLPQKFREKYGFDIFDKLPETIWELQSGNKSEFRMLMHEFMTTLFIDAFPKNISAWCGKNNILLTGHMMAEETLEGQTRGNGEEMPAYRHMSLPGIDMFANDYFYTCAKQAQSIVRQDGKEGMSSELYGVSNWNYDFRGHKNQGDWQAALGVTIRVPHLSHASMKGGAKRDYPQFFSYQSPWYERYSYLENHYARLNTALTRGRGVVKVGVIHPIESCHMNFGPLDKCAGHIKGLDEVFKNVCQWLLEGQIDFDYISESLLPQMIGEISSTLNVGLMSYSAIVVAGCETLRSSTLDILERFEWAGGKIVFASDAPKYENATLSERPQRLFEKCTHVQLDKYNLINALESERLIKVTEEDMTLCSDCVYQLRRDNNCSWLFIAPMHRLNLERKNYADAKKRTVRIKGEYTPVIYDTLSGEIYTADFDTEGGYTYVYHTFYQSSSLLLRLNPLSEKSHRAKRQNETLIRRDFIFDKVDCERAEPNVVLFDGGKYRIDDGKWRGYEDIRKMHRIILAECGYKNFNCLQPWLYDKHAPNEHCVTLQFEFNSEIEISNARIGCENGDIITASLNGKAFPLEEDGYFTDRAIKTYPVPPIRKGENVLEISMPFGKYSEIENYFLLGEFDVRLEGTQKTLLMPAYKKAFGDISSQGMPFYGGSLIYGMDIDAPCDCDADITLSSFAAPAIAVLLDGEDKGTIAFAPYKMRLNNLKKGKHRLEFIAYGNRHNSFGALHTTTNEEIFINAGSWSFETDESCTYKYEYELRRFGILASPKIEYFKTEDIKNDT